MLNSAEPTTHAHPTASRPMASIAVPLTNRVPANFPTPTAHPTDTNGGTHTTTRRAQPVQTVQGQAKSLWAQACVRHIDDALEAIERRGCWESRGGLGFHACVEYLE
jgi:hypothetical protein